MNFDFCYLPAFEMTEQRMHELDRMAKNGQVLIAIRSLPSLCTWQKDGNQVTAIKFDGMDHVMWVTGGMSDGATPPTTAYEAFQRFESEDVTNGIYEKILEWSKADYTRLGLGTFNAVWRR